MLVNILITSILIFFLGIIYGFLFLKGKKHLLYFPNPIVSFLFTAARFLFLISFCFYVIKFLDYNPILIITLFVSSYLSTITILTYKIDQEKENLDV